jgi:hypothetical protein
MGGDRSADPYNELMAELNTLAIEPPNDNG